MVQWIRTLLPVTTLYDYAQRFLVILFVRANVLWRLWATVPTFSIFWRRFVLFISVSVLRIYCSCKIGTFTTPNCAETNFCHIQSSSPNLFDKVVFIPFQAFICSTCANIVLSKTFDYFISVQTNYIVLKWSSKAISISKGRRIPVEHWSYLFRDHLSKNCYVARYRKF